MPALTRQTLSALIEQSESYQLALGLREKLFLVFQELALEFQPVNTKFYIYAVDGNGNKLASQFIEFSDFKYNRATLWFRDFF